MQTRLIWRTDREMNTAFEYEYRHAEYEFTGLIRVTVAACISSSFTCAVVWERLRDVVLTRLAAPA